SAIGEHLPAFDRFCRHPVQLRYRSDIDPEPCLLCLLQLREQCLPTWLHNRFLTHQALPCDFEVSFTCLKRTSAHTVPTVSASETGKVNVNVDPSPIRLSTLICPPCASTRRFTNARPKPVPPPGLAPT